MKVIAYTLVMLLALSLVFAGINEIQQGRLRIMGYVLVGALAIMVLLFATEIVLRLRLRRKNQ